MSAGDTLYLKIGKNIVVTDRRVTLGDVAKICLLYTSPSPRDTR